MGAIGICWLFNSKHRERSKRYAANFTVSQGPTKPDLPKVPALPAGTKKHLFQTLQCMTVFLYVKQLWHVHIHTALLTQTTGLESGVGLLCPSSSKKRTAWWPFSWRYNLSSGNWTLFRAVSAETLGITKELTTQPWCLSARLFGSPLILEFV